MAQALQPMLRECKEIAVDAPGVVQSIYYLRRSRVHGLKVASFDAEQLHPSIGQKRVCAAVRRLLVKYLADRRTPEVIRWR